MGILCCVRCWGGLVWKTFGRGRVTAVWMGRCISSINFFDFSYRLDSHLRRIGNDYRNDSSLCLLYLSCPDGTDDSTSTSLHSRSYFLILHQLHMAVHTLSSSTLMT